MKLADIDRIIKYEDMKKHTSFKIGGRAEYFYEPETVEEIINAINVARAEGAPVHVIGNGSNILVSDNGIPGLVIRLGSGFANVSVDGTKITAQSGALLSAVANTALDSGLSGLEFASGIPGSIGGAVVMNAGAYGGEIADVAASITYLDSDLNIKTMSAEDAGFGYRHSVFSGSDMIILEADFELVEGNKDEISEKMAELRAKRIEKQPTALPSAGSVFKRPEGYFAGALIDEAGLRGYSIGGAMVSEKHAGFIVNMGRATAEDVKELIDEIKRAVFVKFNVMLECEIKFLGDE